MTDKLRTLTVPRDLLERALNSTKGIRVWFESREAAQSMINRMATIKSEERKRSCKVYEIGSPLYNTSSYDSVATYIMPVEIHQSDVPDGYPQRGFWLYICPAEDASKGMFVEEL